MASGIYFDRFRALNNGVDMFNKPGNVTSVSVSRDGGLTWVEGFSQDHTVSGTIIGNKKVIFRISANLQADSLPVDFSIIDYDNNTVNIMLIAAAGNYAKNVYAGGNIYMLTDVAWANDDMPGSLGTNVKQDLVFHLRGADFWVTGS